MPSAESQAAHILSILYSAQTNDQHLVRRVQDAVHQTGWTQHLAVAIFTNLESALQKEMLMNQVMKEAYHRASQVVSDIWKFAKEHPVICALVALGILTILMPWVISALGFGELGPIEGIQVGNLCKRIYSNGWLVCRNLCCLVAVKICRLRACEFIVLVLPAPGNVVVMSQTQPHAIFYVFPFRPRLNIVL